MTISELIELYAYAEAIVETVREPLVILDEHFRVKSINKGFRQTFKVSSAETVGRYFYDLGNGQWDIPALRHLLENVLPKKRNFEDYEVDHTFPDIGRKVMVINARTVILAEYRTKLILVAIEDVTDKRIIEERTEKFISMASHELRTPLTSIKGFLQLLEKKLSKGMDKPTAFIMSRVMSQLNVLNDMVRDLFDMRKIKEGTLVIRKKNIRIGPVIQEAVDSFRYVTDTHPITLEGNVNEKVAADRERIIQVVTNLLTNAAKYSPKNKPIKVMISAKKDNVTVAIQDSGKGIKKEEQPNLFSAYYTTDKQTGKVGLGLGLYICSEIIKRHNGTIWMESKAGKGSTFYFSLPTIE